MKYINSVQFIVSKPSQYLAHFLRREAMNFKEGGGVDDTKLKITSLHAPTIITWISWLSRRSPDVRSHYVTSAVCNRTPRPSSERARAAFRRLIVLRAGVIYTDCLTGGARAHQQCV